LSPKDCKHHFGGKNAADLEVAGDSMGRILFVFMYAASYMFLHFVDAWSTHSAITSGLGREVNPLMNTDSLVSLLFDPINIVVLTTGTAIVCYSEFNRVRMNTWLETGWIALLGAPYVFLILKIFPVMNNTMLHAGLGAPISLLTRFSDNLFFSMIVFASILATLLQFPVKYFLKLRYQAG
jgi:hypothetical protein